MAEKYEFDGIDGQEWIRDIEDGSMYCSLEELALLLNNQYDSVEVLKKINAVLEKRVERNVDAYAECNKKLAKLQQKYQKQTSRLQQKLAEKEEEIEILTINNKVKIQNTTDSTYSEDTNAALDIKGGVSIDKQMSAKSVRIDNNCKDKGCTLIMNLDLNCLEFVFN